MMKEYHVGDQVWVATFNPSAEVKVTCPVCYGEKKVTLILGNGDSVILPCQHCQQGQNGPTGFVTEQVRSTKAEKVTIDTVRITETMEGQTREYEANGQALPKENIFDTETEALEKAKRLAAEWIAEHDPLKEIPDKSYSWNAGYHLQRMENLRKKLRYHKKRAMLCRAIANDGRDENNESQDPSVDDSVLGL